MNQSIFNIVCLALCLVTVARANQCSLCGSVNQRVVSGRWSYKFRDGETCQSAYFKSIDYDDRSSMWWVWHNCLVKIVLGQHNPPSRRYCPISHVCWKLSLWDGGSSVITGKYRNICCNPNASVASPTAPAPAPTPTTARPQKCSLCASSSQRVVEGRWSYKFSDGATCQSAYIQAVNTPISSSTW